MTPAQRVKAQHLLASSCEWVTFSDARNVISTMSSLLYELMEEPRSPPPGYTVEELERDNPFNAWVREDGT